MGRKKEEESVIQVIWQGTVGTGTLVLSVLFCGGLFLYTIYHIPYLYIPCFEGGIPGRRLLGGAEDALCHPLAPFKFLKSIIFNSS